MTDITGVELELAHNDTGTMVLAGQTPEDILANATRIADALKGLIEKQGLAVDVGRDRKHVEVGGWQAAGAMLGALGGQAIHAETDFCRRIWDERESDEIAYEARVEVKTLDGKVVGAAEAMCSSVERNWRGRDEFTIKSMAETRAESRAYRRAIGWVIKLAGYSPTPAEETTSASSNGATTPAWARHVDDVAEVAQTLTALLVAVGVEDAGQKVATIGQRIFDECDNGIPECVARIIDRIADAVQTPAEGPVVDAEPTPDDDASEPTTETQEAA